MVKFVDTHLDITSDQWLEALSARLPQVERDLVNRADAWVRQFTSVHGHSSAQSSLDHARGAAAVLAGLRVGGEAIAATLLLGASIATRAEREALRSDFGPAVISLVDGVASMAQVQALRSRNDGVKGNERSSQLESLRKMFLAMAQDVRVVLIKLADQLQCLRELARKEESGVREDIARETLELFSPLANRLGVWQLKWELEDLAFRCLEPAMYRKLARELDEKRMDRQIYLDEVIRIVRAALAEAGIDAQVSGRPKHIYSIWRKMQRKGVGLSDLVDVRAVRVIVGDVKDCYTVLGVVHNLWTPIPGEFDDYIARPKTNDYQSLHTAVFGPESRVLEVQVRSHEMHQHAELGVAAHWRYKEAVKGDHKLDEKISWLRSVLEWKAGLADTGGLAEYLKSDLFQDVVYVVTPQGRVVDLARGSTPVDFAYHLHSELGHRCRGARVNGQIVPLTYALANGQTVEIIAAKVGGPSRDWLNSSLGYIKTNRARAKIRQWFNNHQLDEAVAHGRAVLEKDLRRLGKTGQNLEELASRLEFAGPNELFAALGRGEVTARQVQSAVLGKPMPDEKVSAQAVLPQPTAGPSGVLIVGVDKLLTVLARCCKPAPPDRIVGFVTRGRGVTVHRVDCHNVARLPQERIVAADWGKTGSSRFPVDIEVIAGSHPALMRDILEVFTREKVRVADSTSYRHELNSKMAFTLEIEGLPQLTRLLTSVLNISGVESARRK